MRTIKVTADSWEDLETLLSAQGVAAQRFETKGMAEMQMLLIAVGGGTGVAAILTGIGQAIKLYFQGKAEVEGKRAIEITVNGKVIKITGGNVEDLLRHLQAILG
jgi:hypothetical protein